MRAGKQQQSPPHGRRLPRRGTDWVEDTAAWVLATAALVCAVLSMFVGVRVYGTLLDRAHQEAVTRTPVQAVLLQDASPIAGAVDQGIGPVAQVPVRWVDTDGAVRVSQASVDGAPHAGDTVTVWVDRAHHLVPQPTNIDDATAAGYVSAGIVLFMTLAMLAVVWCGVRQVALTRNCARWAREWAVVEPLWSGRTYGGRLS